MPYGLVYSTLPNKCLRARKKLYNHICNCVLGEVKSEKQIYSSCKTNMKLFPEPLMFT